ncbi:MAG: ComF family protein [Ancalomicrobiaceae bacterium]|nr:ComF family protein [Ancalomicrobiaceae bacterium]
MDEVPETVPLSRRFHRLGHGLWRRAIDWVLPPVCAACGAPVADPEALCGACWGALQFIERPYCERLGIPFGYDLGPGALSAEAIANPPPFGRARAAVIYAGPARDLIHALKYNDRPELAGLIGRMMARAGHEILADADLLVPIPLHRWRLLTRKFNQSALLAQAVGRASGVAVDLHALERIKATRPQVGLSGRDRQENVRGAFRVAAANQIRVAGRRVVLVDDAYTTGATIGAATRALQRAGVAQVDVLTFARATLDGAIGT